MYNLTDYTDNIEPSNTLKDFSQKNISENFSDLCDSGVENLVLNSNLCDKTNIK
ncbi:MAG: hypothetical protein ACRC7N_01330 [Clostridium sp.]